MTAVSTFLAKPRGTIDWLPFLQDALQELDDGIAALVGGALTDALVYAADAVTSAADIDLDPGDATALAVSLTTSGKRVRLPDAAVLVEGRWRSIKNVGANAFALQDYEGTVLLASLGVGDTAFLWLEDNTDSAGGGTWRVAVIPATTVDQTARDIAVAALIEANAAGVAGPKGPLALVDPFTSDSLDISADATYDAGGDYYHNQGTPAQIAQGTGTIIGDMTSGGGNAAAFDGTTAQTNANCATKGSTTAAYVGKDWGSGNSEIVARYKIWGSSNEGLGNSVNITVSLEGSATGAWGGEEVTLHTDTFADSNGVSKDYTSDIDVSTAYRYHRVLVEGTSGSFWIAEVQFYDNGDPPDPVYQEGGGSDGNGALLTADPADLLAWFLIEPVDALTPGTDIVGKLSCDGGLTWATGDWTQVGAFDDGKELWRLEADVSGQSGDTAAFRLEGANSKEWRLHQCGGLLPVY